MRSLSSGSIGLSLSHYLAAILLMVILAICSIALGAGSPNFSESLGLLSQSIFSLSWQPIQPLLELRIPRTIAALAVGAALSIAGVILQTLLKNPLADSGLIGINSGASLAIVIAIIFQFSSVSLFFWAISGALISALLVFALNQKTQNNPASLTRLILAGLAIASTFHGIMAALLLHYQDGLEQYRFWILGSFNRIESGLLWIALCMIAIGICIAFLIVRPLTISLVGGQLARSLGLNVWLLEFSCIIAVVLLAGSAVALTGPIAFLGLIAPYFARALGALDLKKQLLYSSYLGMLLLLCADILARIIVQPFETPVSILLAMIGAPLLIWMVRQDHMQSIVQAEK